MSATRAAVLGLLICGLGAGSAQAAASCGDTDGNGRRDAADAARLARCAAEPEGCDPDRWDTNLDGVLDAADAERVVSCDSGARRCACGSNTIRVIVLPDLQCLVSRDNYSCIDEFVEARYGVRKNRENRDHWREIWQDLLHRDDFPAAADANLEESLDVLDATMRGLLALRPPPDLILAVGDVINEGHGACSKIRPGRRAKVEAQWPRLLRNTRGRIGYAALLESGIPVVTAQGNHDECGFEKHLGGASPRRRADAQSFDAKLGPGLALARHWGNLPDESAWLAGQAAAHPQGPVFLTTHDQVQRLSNGDCRWLGRNEFGSAAARLTFVTGGHYMHYDNACKEVEGGRLLSYANFQQLEHGGQGYFVEARFWPRSEPSLPAGSFEVRTWSAWHGESWEQNRLARPGHRLAGKLDWSRYE